MARSSGGGGGDVSSRISREVAVKAVDALLQWLRNREVKPQLLEDDEFVYLQISLQRFPSSSPKSGRVNPRFLPIPHPIYIDQSSSVSLCVFFDDREPSASAAAILDRARSLSLPVESAMGLSSLRTDYRPFESRRRLCDSYDLFFADRRIIPLLPRVIGKEFFRKKKTPLPIEFSRSNWPEQLRRCLNSAFLHPLSKGTSAAIKVGRVSMTSEKVAENVMAVIEGALEYVPKGFENIRSVHVKAARSVALPIYQAVPQMGLKITVPSLTKDNLHGDEHDQDLDTKSDEVEDEEFSSQKKKKKQKGRIHEEIMGFLEMNKNDTVDKSDLDEDDNGEEGGREENDKSTPTKKRKIKDGKIKDKKAKKGKKHDKGENFDASSAVFDDKLNENNIVDEDENDERGGREEDEKSTTMRKSKKKDRKTKDKKEKNVKKLSNEENFGASMLENDLLVVKKNDISVALNKKMKNKGKTEVKKVVGQVKKSKKTKLRQT